MYTQSQKYLALYALQLFVQSSVSCLKNAFEMVQRLVTPRTYMIFDHNNTCVAVINDYKSALNWKVKGYSVFRSVKTIRETENIKFNQI